MGDGADMAIEAIELYEDLRLDFHTGLISQEEAYDLGIIDELGYEIKGSKLKTCRCCKQTGLHWEKNENKWRLFDNKGLHKCPKVPLK